MTDPELNNSMIVQPTLRNNNHGFCLLGPPEWGCSGDAQAVRTATTPSLSRGIGKAESTECCFCGCSM
jgi:hypothetical protein